LEYEQTKVSLETEQPPRDEALEEGEYRAQESESIKPSPGFESRVPGNKTTDKKRASTKNTKSAGPKGSLSKSQTSKSLEQIARELLQMGRLLGLSVVQNERAATSRIKATLRTNKTNSGQIARKK